MHIYFEVKRFQYFFQIVFLSTLLIQYTDMFCYKQVKTVFYKLVQLTNGKAETIFECIKTTLFDDEISLKHMAGFGWDGASVTVGKQTGVSEFFKMLKIINLATHKQLINMIVQSRRT